MKSEFNTLNFRPDDMPEVPDLSDRLSGTATEIIQRFFDQVWRNRLDDLRSKRIELQLQLPLEPVTFIPLEELTRSL